MVEGDALDDGTGPDAATPAKAPPSRVRPNQPFTIAEGRPTRAGWAKLSEDELERAAKLAARGVDVPTIAAALLLEEKTVARALRSRKGAHKVRWLRGRAILAELEHEEAMRDLLPSGRVAIRDGLSAANAKDAAGIGLKLHEAVIQKPPQRIEHTHQGRIEHDLTPIFEKLTQSLERIREAQAGRDPLARVVRGDVGLAQHRPLLPAETDSSDGG